MRNADNELVGIDKSKSGKMRIWVSENKIDELRKINQIDGKTYPEDDFPENERILKGFVWRETERPRSVKDLFSEKNPPYTPYSSIYVY